MDSLTFDKLMKPYIKKINKRNSSSKFFTFLLLSLLTKYKIHRITYIFQLSSFFLKSFKFSI